MRGNNINIPELRFPTFNSSWLNKSFSDLFDLALRPTSKPNTAYMAIGIRSHFKGTFQRFDDPGKIAMDTLYEVKKDDLIINITFAWEGAVAVVSDSDEGGLVSHRFPTYRANDKNLIIGFFKYVYPTKKFKYHLKNISPGGAGRNRVLRKQDLLKANFAIPSLPEQEKIADFLSTVDAKISALKKKKELLELYKKGLMQKIFSREIRFRDENGGEFPEWEEKRLGEIASFYSGGTPTSTNKKYYTGDIPFIGSGNISDKEVFQFITVEALKNSSAKMVEKGDLLYAMYGATSGEVAISKIRGAINQAILCIKTTEDNHYIYHYLFYMKDRIITKYLQGGQGNLSASIIKKLSIPLPSKGELKMISILLDDIDASISTYRIRIDKAEQWKKGLLQKMFV